MPTYLGPADTFELDGKPYRQGQNIPASKEVVAHMTRFGHRFAGEEPAEGAVLTVPVDTELPTPEPKKK